MVGLNNGMFGSPSSVYRLLPMDIEWIQVSAVLDKVPSFPILLSGLGTTNLAEAISFLSIRFFLPRRLNGIWVPCCNGSLPEANQSWKRQEYYRFGISAASEHGRWGAEVILYSDDITSGTLSRVWPNNGAQAQRLF